MKSRWPIRAWCRVFWFSESGYSGWRRSDKVSVRTRLPDQLIVVHIRAIHREVNAGYGWPRMYQALRRRGLRVGKERVRVLMQAHGIRGKAKRRYVATTDSKHVLPVAPNRVQRHFTPDAPNQIWCSDITYLPTAQGWLYLAAVMGLSNRQDVGWRLQQPMQSILVHKDLIMA